MDAFFAVVMNELTNGWPAADEWARVSIRLLAAALLGAVIGFTREQVGKPAGLRTHMLVSMGSAFFVIAPLETDFSSEDLSRIIQGIATGLGFIGGGAILKLQAQREITGLTTAAGIWMTAAIGVAVGLGRLGSALLGVVLSWVILAVLGRLEASINMAEKAKADDKGK